MAKYWILQTICWCICIFPRSWPATPTLTLWHATYPPPQDPRQFWTLFPHTPDNSFLGFVVEPVAMAADVKKNQAVIYGKEGTEVW